MLGAAVVTHAGRVRTQNEDNALCLPGQGLFAVVDGMGGEAAGEVAAALAVAALTEVPSAPRVPGERALTDALHKARRNILTEAEQNPACARMGAVATALRFDDRGDAVVVAHVGDSRAWRVNSGGVVQLTEDHVASTPEPGRTRPAVTRDLGRRDLEGEWVSTRRVPVRRGDLLVLATDGLHDPVAPEELTRELAALHASGADAEAVCARLVALALARGGPDNVTVLAVRVGPFRRGRAPLRRLGLPATVALLGLLVGAVVLAASLARERAAAVVPAQVFQAVELSRAPSYPLAGPRTDVVAEGSLSTRGIEITGESWLLSLAPGTETSLLRTLVTLDGELVVKLGEGATLTATDTRFDVRALRVEGAGGRVRWDHATLPEQVVVGPEVQVSGVEQAPPEPGPSEPGPSEPEQQAPPPAGTAAPGGAPPGQAPPGQAPPGAANPTRKPAVPAP